MMAPAAFGRIRYCRFVHTETARAKPMHSKGLWRPDSEEFSAHPEPSRTPAAHARGHPASSRLLCELLDRILAGVRIGSGGLHQARKPVPDAAVVLRPVPGVRWTIVLKHDVGHEGSSWVLIDLGHALLLTIGTR